MMRKVRIPRFMRGIFLFALVALATLAGGAQAAPYRPTDDGAVLEKVPPAAAGRISALPPQTPESAAALAQVYIERARRDGDPRWLGYAQGVLQPWWEQRQPPQPVLLLRATLLQSRHQFDAALRDLELLLGQHPKDAQARLTQATVLRVQGRYAEARTSCLRLLGHSDDFVAGLCAIAVEGLGGSLAPALKKMQGLEAASAVRAPAIQAWYWAERSEMLERIGQTAAAETAYRRALTMAPDDLGLRAAYADFLLDQRRPADALTVLDADPSGSRADALRLRQALARRALGRPDAALQAAIEDGYAAAHRRGEELHLREEARYTLEVLGDAPRALALAQQNWAVQREPWDARLLLAAAKASGQPQAAGPVREWLRATGFEDARLRPWLEPQS